jgi:hypothetical protein
MGAGDEHVLAAQLHDALGVDLLFQLVGLVAFVRRQPARLDHVRRKYRGLRKEHLAHRRDQLVAREFVAAARGEHRI